MAGPQPKPQVEKPAEPPDPEGRALKRLLDGATPSGQAGPGRPDAASGHPDAGEAARDRSAELGRAHD